MNVRLNRCYALAFLVLVLAGCALPKQVVKPVSVTVGFVAGDCLPKGVSQLLSNSDKALLFAASTGSVVNYQVGRSYSSALGLVCREFSVLKPNNNKNYIACHQGVDWYLVKPTVK